MKIRLENKKILCYLIPLLQLTLEWHSQTNLSNLNRVEENESMLLVAVLV